MKNFENCHIIQKRFQRSYLGCERSLAELLGSYQGIEHQCAIGVQLCWTSGYELLTFSEGTSGHQSSHLERFR